MTTPAPVSDPAPLPPLNLLYQTHTVDKLLAAAVDSLPHLPAEQKTRLYDALKPFEDCVVPTTWGVGDLPDDASLERRREALNLFVDDYEVNDMDFIQLEQAFGRTDGDEIPDSDEDGDPSAGAEAGEHGG